MTNHNGARVAILHHVGSGNIGDEASVEAVVQSIRARWPDAEIVAISMDPLETAASLGVPAFPLRSHTWAADKHCGESLPARRRNAIARWLGSSANPLVRIPRALLREIAFLVRSWKTIQSIDHLVVAGGGQLTDRSGPLSFPYSIFIWISIARLAGARRIFLNVGAGPLDHPLTRFLVKRSLYSADYVSFRDEPSQALTRHTGYTGGSWVGQDNVYALTTADERPVHSTRRDPVVGISPMPYPYCDPREHRGDDLQALYADYVSKIAIFSESVVARSFTLDLFGNDKRADPPVIEDLRSLLRSRHGIDIRRSEAIETLPELFRRIAGMDYVLTCRYHGVVFAHVWKKPVLAIAHHPKVADLMSELGLGEYCFDIRTFTPARLTDAFDSLVSNNERIRASLAESLDRRQSKLAAQIDSLFPPQARRSPAMKSKKSDSETILAGRHAN